LKKTILIIFFGIIAAVIAVLALLPRDTGVALEFVVLNYFFPMYETKDLVNVESPDHQYVATGYHVFGGATVHDSTIVVVHAQGQSYTDRTNEPVLIADNIKKFNLIWSKNRLLVVECSLDNTYSKKSIWKDVTVQYVEK